MTAAQFPSRQRLLYVILATALLFPCISCQPIAPYEPLLAYPNNQPQWNLIMFPPMSKKTCPTADIGGKWIVRIAQYYSFGRELAIFRVAVENVTTEKREILLREGFSAQLTGTRNTFGLALCGGEVEWTLIVKRNGDFEIVTSGRGTSSVCVSPGESLEFSIMFMANDPILPAKGEIRVLRCCFRSKDAGSAKPEDNTLSLAFESKHD